MESGTVNKNTSTSLGEITTIMEKAPTTVITVVKSCTTSCDKEVLTVSMS